ncbi:hypothetical protein CPB83DRAFT_738974, partial [Crepidotus variabilis]
FCQTELQRALKEQEFGIKSFSMNASSSTNSATANVVLLEGQKMLVQLTMQGYSIANSATAGVHETIEALLQCISPLYTKKKQEALFAALSRL